MNVETRNAALIRSLYERFAQGDVPSVLADLDPEIQWTEAEGFPYAGTYRGPQAVLDGVFVRLDADWQAFRVQPDEFVDGGDAIVALGDYSGTFKATGRSFRAPFAHLWRMRDGRVIRFVQYVDTVLVQRAMQA